MRSFSRFYKDPSEPEWPRIYRAELSNFAFQSQTDNLHNVCSGKGLTDIIARTSALGEAVERYSGGIWPPEVFPRFKRKDLVSRSIDPGRLVLYDEDQYPLLPYDAYNDESILGWVEGRSFVDDTPVMVPAMAVLMNYAPAPGECRLLQLTSNGLAAGPTLADASLRAALEVIERDAFISSWLLRLAAERINPTEHPCKATRGVVESYRRRGVDIELYRLHTDLPVYTFVGFGVGRTEDIRPAMVVGLGADFDPVSAARSAILEVAQVRPALRFRLRDPVFESRRQMLVAHPAAVKELEDHDLRYAGAETLPIFDFIRSSPSGSIKWDSPTASRGSRVRELTRALSLVGSDLICVNLTPPDMKNLDLYTVRAIIPGLQPIYFGEQERRLARQRLSQLFYQFREFSSFSHFDINSDPHPVA